VSNKSTLATLNCDFSVLSADNLNQHLTFLKNSLRLRTQLIAGNGYGIVDSEDPTVLISNEVKSLWPTFASTSYSVVDVSAGIAVTPNGDVIELTESTSVTVAGLTDNVESVILLQYKETDSTTLGYSTDGVSVPIGQNATAVLTSITKLEYLDPSVTTDDTIANSVVLGVVQWSNTDVPVLYTTQTSGYTWNRPWFSANDIEHRNQIGTGEVTSTNPHGTSVSDLSAGSGLHVYDHLTSSGMILSRDNSVPGIPGSLCYDTFGSSTIIQDNTSTKTAGSWFSGFGVYYVELSLYPNTVHKAVDGNGDEIALDWIRGTKICVLVTDVVVTSLTVHYTATPSMAIASVNQNTISFKQMVSPDIGIAEGQAVTTLLIPTVPLRKYSLVPREITFKLSAAGQVFADPNVILASRGVAAFTGASITLNATMPVPGVVGVGLMGLPSLTSSACAFTISGLDQDGNTITDTLYFDNTNWIDAGAVPVTSEAPQQVQYTTNVYAFVTSITIPGSGSYAAVDVGSANFIVLTRADYANAKTARLASGFWDGTALVNLRDTRRIFPVVKDGFYGYNSLQQAAEIIPGVNNVLNLGNRAQLIVAEDFSQPMYLDATTVTWDGLGDLDVPVITDDTPASDKILRCYRSRAIPMPVDPASPLRLIVVLFGADPNVNTLGCARLVGVNRSGTTREGIMVPAIGDNTGSVFVGYDSIAWSSVSIVISGRCRGFAAYFIRPVETESTYFMEMI
jgi:hypothetical protein